MLCVRVLLFCLFVVYGSLLSSQPRSSIRSRGICARIASLWRREQPSVAELVGQATPLIPELCDIVAEYSVDPKPEQLCCIKTTRYYDDSFWWYSTRLVSYFAQCVVAPPKNISASEIVWGSSTITVQPVVNAFAVINRSLIEYGIANGVLWPCLWMTVCDLRSDPNFFKRVIVGVTVLPFVSAATFVTSIFFLDAWGIRRAIGRKYPYALPADIADCLKIPKDERGNYRLRRKPYIEDAEIIFHEHTILQSSHEMIPLMLLPRFVDR